MFPLGTVLFPGAPLPLHVFEPRYRALMHDVMAEPEPWSFGVVAIREGHEVGAESIKSLYDVGCVAVIRQVQQAPDGRFAVLLVGGSRLHVRGFDQSRPYLMADVDLLDEPFAGELSDELASSVRQRFVDYCSALGEEAVAAHLPDDPTELSYVVATAMMLPLGERQALLEAAEVAQRLQMEAGLLSRELALIRTGTMPIAQPRLPPQSTN